jgi:hypothetical protein
MPTRLNATHRSPHVVYVRAPTISGSPKHRSPIASHNPGVSLECPTTSLAVFIRHRRLLPTSAVCCQQTAMPNEDVAHACRGRDGSGCGFGANRQVAGELHAQEDGQDVLQEALFQCLAGKRPASRSPSPQRRPPVQRAENSFGGDANAVSHRQVGRGRAPEGASWTGCQHEFDNPTSEDAVWYGSFF